MQILKDAITGEIDEFKVQIERFLSGTISEEKFKTLRLNHGVYSQRQPGFYMVRTKLPQGRILDYQLERIADVAQQYARGLVHLTTRQDIQIHWVDLKHVHEILSAYAEAGITTREACGNSVRNITSCPLAGVCPKEAFDVSGIAHETTEHFLRNPICQNLPRKFKISFSGCSDDCVYSRINDIGFIATERDGMPGFKVYAGGGLGGHPRAAYPIKDFLGYDETIQFADAVIRVFDRHGNRTNRNMARLKYVFEEKGIDAVKSLIEKEYTVVKDIYGEQPHADIAVNGSTGPADYPTPSDKDRAHWTRHNVRMQAQKGYCAVIVHLPCGDATSQGLRDVVRVSRLYGSGEIRTTLDQNFIVPWIGTGNLDGLYNDLNRAGLIARDNAALDIVSCPGAKTCNLGIARSQGLAQAIHDELDANLSGDLSDVRIRVCGCPNSCGQHHIGSIGFSGMARRIGERHAPFYQVYLGGNGKEQGFCFARPFLKIPAKNAPALTRGMIELYNSTKRADEPFNAWVTRYGEERLAEELLMYSYLPEYERAPEFYYDYGMDEPFTIKDIGKGECAGGTVDTIEIYLNRAETRIMDADTFAGRGIPEQSLAYCRTALTYAVQAMLITQGVDPDTAGADIGPHVTKLREEGIIDNSIEDISIKLHENRQIDDTKGTVRDVRNAIHRIRKITESFDDALLSGKLIRGMNKVEVEMSKEILDLKGVKCPYNYVKAKLKLEELTSGDELEIYLDEGEPITNVPRSLEDDGNVIVSIDKLDDAHFRLLVKKG
ncbi:MAG: sulfurtransferase TusA family protein [Deltaproteobacteria bacterium]|nr:sulfurtransferase TusA family protein [Deltaproteobacteria bacterium]